MSKRYSTRSHHGSVTLIVTFLLGIGIGFALCYAYLETLGVNLSDTIPQAPPEPQAVMQEAQQSLEAPQEEVREIATLQQPGRHLFVAIDGLVLGAEMQSLLAQYTPGGVVLGAENVDNPKQLRALVQAIKAACLSQDENAIAPIIAIAQAGGETGNPLRLSSAPSPQALGAANDLTAIHETARRYGEAARAVGVEMLLAPSLDVYQDSLSDPLLQESCFGRLPAAVTQCGIAFVDGLESTGVVSAIKNFPGAGAAVRQDSGERRILLTDMRALAELMFPFAEMATRQVSAILVDHIVVPALGREDRETPPASLSPLLLNTIVRKKWSYNGLLLANDITQLPQSPADATVAALAAGCDAVLVLHDVAQHLPAICTVLQETNDTDLVAHSREAQTRLSLLRQRLDAEPEVATPAPVLAATETMPEETEPQSEAAPVAEAAPVEESAPSEGDAVLASEEGAVEIDAEEGTDTPDSMPGEITPQESVEAITIAVAPVVDESVEEPESVTPPPVTPESTEAVVAEETPAPTEGAVEENSVPEEVTENTAEDIETAAPLESSETEEELNEESPMEEAAAAAPETASVSAEGTSNAEEEEVDESPKEGEDAHSPNAAPTSVASNLPTDVPPDTRIVLHKIQRGDTLLGIARKYGVSASDLKTWNKLSSNTIKYGRILKVFAPQEETPTK